VRGERGLAESESAKGICDDESKEGAVGGLGDGDVMASSWDEEGVKEKGQQSGSEGNEPEHRTGSDIALTAAATAASTAPFTGSPSPRAHPRAGR
jgi:hypothetical protein